MTNKNSYESPLISRYASQEMSYVFSPQYKHATWRKLWVALAKAEQSLGLSISDKQITAMESNIENIDFEKAKEYEKIHRHDVVAHIHTFGDACPESKAIIHLGATSCYVTDNTDLIQMREALYLLRGKCLHVIHNLKKFAEKHADLACLSFTHFQAAQPTTVGKRACLWLQDFIFDFHDLSSRIEDMQFLGAKGATGTQASFLALFENDSNKVKTLEKNIAHAMGFTKIIPLSGQTYSRKLDMRIFSALTGLAATASKIATDLRLLAHLKEIEEPFSEKQIGSSAMPYKRNPMRCERICALSRFLISLSENPSYTAATQWLERSLDDSANRRLAIPEGFLTADALLNLLINVTENLVVYPKQIQKNLEKELPFIATENILMASVKKGKDRQILHEKLRNLALKAKEEGEAYQLLEHISKDPDFSLSRSEINDLLKLEHFIGLAPLQVHDYLKNEVNPLLSQHKEALSSITLSPINF
ncbi:MAG: adenylosuccinate lyase [Chlamydiota bacterium]